MHQNYFAFGIPIIFLPTGYKIFGYWPNWYSQEKTSNSKTLGLTENPF